MTNSLDTIFAQCSAKGRAGVTIFRISGQEAASTLGLFINDDIKTLDSRKCYFRKIINPHNSEIIDEALVIIFRGRASFTGEDSVEIHTHGSIAIIRIMHELLASVKNVRLAEPGEFAKRSFFNGKMDLTSAEGLADLIDAETQMQHRQAIRQLGGGLEKIYEKWRIKLIKIISLLEAYIDFPDEPIPDRVVNDARIVIDEISNDINKHLNDNKRGERLRSGLKLAILGKPNSGKSSLMNYLMQRDFAIVSDIPGTTRDVIEGHLDIRGYPIILQDTAGIRSDTNDAIEQAGIDRAKQTCADADIKILLVDSLIGLTQKDESSDFQEYIDKNTIIVFNKIDLISDSIDLTNMQGDISISVKKEIGIDDLLSKIEEIAERIARPTQDPQITRARHRGQLLGALNALQRVDFTGDLVLAAEDIRLTISSISNITGKITVDEILGEIFNNFCIGK